MKVVDATQFSFHAVLLALALVVQTAAGGHGVAAMSAAGVGARAAHCQPGSTHDQSLPDGSGHHKHDCLSCQACANAAAAVSPTAVTEHRIEFRDPVRVQLAFGFIAAPSWRIAHAHQARAPPFFS